MSFNFSTTSSCVSYPSNQSFTTNTSTVLMWIYPTASINLRRLFQYNVTFAKGYRLATSGASNVPQDLRLAVSKTVSDVEYLTQGRPIQLNRWNFIGVTFDPYAPTGSLAKFYVGYENIPANITLSGNLSGAPIPLDGTGSVTYESNSVLTVGNTVNSGNPWSGYIANVHYLNTALSLQDIRQQQFNPTPLPSTIMMSDFRTIGSGSDLGGHNVYGSPQFVSLAPQHYPPTTPQ